MAKVFKYILDFEAQTEKFGKDVGGMTGMLKGAALAAGAFFAADQIVAAADAVADYAVEISKVRTEIGMLSGAHGAALDAMTGQVMALSDSYGSDVSENLKATNALMREFGITGKAAFDIMNAGFASSANSGGDFTEQVSEYATHFREAGLSAEEMLAIIAGGNVMGVFGDKASDAIKESSIRLREMTQATKDALKGIGLSSTQIQADISSGNKSMFDVMQLVSKQLQTLPQQSPAVGAALADIFGGPGEDAVNFIRSLATMDLSLQGVVDNATKSQMEWTSELAEFHSIGAQVFGGTANMMTEVKTAALNMANETIKGIVGITNYFIELYNEAIVFRGAIEWISLGFKQAWEAVKGALGIIWENLKATGKMIKAIFTLDAAGIAEAWKTGLTGVVDVVKEYGQNTAENFMDAWNNTMSPKKKIALISISEGDANAAGIAAGKNFATGIKTGAATLVKSPIAALKTISSTTVTGRDKAIDTKKVDDGMGLLGLEKRLSSLKEAQTKSLDTKEWLNYQKAIDNTAERITLFTGGFTEEMKAAEEMQKALADTFSEGFNNIGQSVVNGLGLAENGIQGFIGGMLSTVISLVSMFLAQSLAASIAGATTSGAATGPAAIVTTPAFIATAIAGVLGAFAAIPAFEAGGIVSGPTLGLMGEYPGASTNPEVIAPLSKLKAMMGSTGSPTIVLQPSLEMTGDRFRIMMKRVEGDLRKRT
jgi:TP901 family phage tail tape measure protein